MLRSMRSGSSNSAGVSTNRCIDTFCACEKSNKAFAIECKYQDSQGTVDETFRMRSTTCARCRYPAASHTQAEGFPPACCTCRRRPGTRHTASDRRSERDDQIGTKELDDLMAAHFGWWDVLVEKKRSV
jgi:hypothetical protein